MAKNFLNELSLPIGFRNNNPGNIRPGSDWQGMTGTSNNFVVFKDISYGLRALAIDISNKIKGGYNTISKIINRYAPPSENDTLSYINAVTVSTGIPADMILPYDYNHLLLLMKAIVRHENGPIAETLLDDSDYDEGIRMMPSTFFERVADFFGVTPDTMMKRTGGVLPVLIAIIISIIIIVLIYKQGKNG